MPQNSSGGLWGPSDARLAKVCLFGYGNGNGAAHCAGLGIGIVRADAERTRQKGKKERVGVDVGSLTTHGQTAKDTPWI